MVTAQGRTVAAAKALWMRRRKVMVHAVDLGTVPARIRMLDALDRSVLTELDVADVRQRYGFPYLVMHRSDLHSLLLGDAHRLGVDLVTGAGCRSC